MLFRSRNRARAAQFDEPVVIFSRQEPQRKADHAALMIEHPLDRVVSLAGVGRSEDRDEARCGTEHRHAPWYRVETAPGQEQTAAKKARSPLAGAVPRPVITKFLRLCRYSLTSAQLGSEEE